ncbi:uncharacterized protein KQ657_002016 [Scheffersomyces spartinae]|uniref:GDT1 family protein n=1 Tax=Scheffersomyces spartinae TaxID=45513 RepID=A0A9P8AHA5_9ASCO|nr:uncharacterized protein KQ657_002016 [Scheffersomyces spartinae]KAG7192297.1 hypothetical protein KQ657_002016 [Scheffersomyces spartinae]
MKLTRVLLAFACASSVLGASAGIDVASQPDDIVHQVKGNDRIGIAKVTDLDNKPANAVQDDDAGSKSSSDFYDSFIMSVSMIIVSEIGDKTFLIAALMAMKYSRVVVFSAAFLSLAVMTILSGIVGHALPTLLSPRLTKFMASGLFIVFGVKLFKEGLEMSKDSGVDEEMAEVEEEIASSNLNTELHDMESGTASSASVSDSHHFKPKSQQKWYEEMGTQLEALATFVFSPVWIQVFLMTFLGEWGDRSQIATIALAAGSNYWAVIFGGIIGHGICTGGACIGGKLMATKISMRTVTLGGAIAFIIFSFLYFYDAYYGIE